MTKTTRQINALTIKERIQMLDWIRAHKHEIPQMSGKQILKLVVKAIGHPCSLEQIRKTARADGVEWKTRNTQINRAAIKSRMEVLEARVIELEAWCIATANGLGVKPPNGITKLPSDEELQS